MILENTSNPIMSYILLGVLVLIIIIGPIFMKRRNKKETERMQEMVDSLKKGDKVITSAGVFGKVIGVEEKEGFKLVTIETGNEKNKSYLTMDVGAIYANLSATPVQQPISTVKEQESQVNDANLQASKQNVVAEKVGGNADEVKDEPINEEPVNNELEEPLVEESTKKEKSKSNKSKKK